jgi:hypothetical protein
MLKNQTLDRNRGQGNLGSFHQPETEALIKTEIFPVGRLKVNRQPSLWHRSMPCLTSLVPKPIF